MSAEAHDRSTPDGAFLADNSFASTAVATVDSMNSAARNDPDLPVMAKSAEIYATLAVAFEQRQTRFDLERVICEASGQV